VKRLILALGVAASMITASAARADKAPSVLVPQAATTLEFPQGVSAVDLPVRIVNGEIIVRVRMGTRGMDFGFDSGAPGTYLNAEEFKALGLGSESDAKNGVATLQIGDLTLHNVIIVSNPLEYRPLEDTKLVGLLGYDLLSRAVVRLDYANGTLDVQKPGTFVAPPNAIAIKLTSQRPPLVAATIGSASGDRFAVDTGAYAVIVLPRFVSAHPELFNAQAEFHNVGEQYVRKLQPICGTTPMTAYKVPDLRVDDVDVPDWLVLTPKQGSCFNIESIDGLLGFDYLRLFTVTFDLPESRIYLVPRQPAQ
jgi:hypothetical protein